MSTVTAWTLAAALWLGCLLSGPWWCALLGLCLTVGAAGARTERRRFLVLILGLLVLGAGLAGARGTLADAASLAALADQGGAADAVGVLVTDPRVDDRGSWAVVRITRLDGVRVRERAAARFGHDPPDLGTPFATRVTARPLGKEGFDGHLRRLHAVAWIDPVGEVATTGAPARLWRVTSGVRTRARAVAGAHSDPDRAAVLTGLLIGDVTGQSAERKKELARAGLTHLVVVSGRHVSLVLAGVLGLAVLLGAGARPRRVIALGALAGYVLLVRWEPSVLRAGVMAGLVLGAGLIGRRADARHSLAMAVVVLLLCDPLLAGHLGFALSVMATGGVLVVAPWLAPRLRGPRAFRVLTAASLGAQVAVAPLLFTLDTGVSLATVPANLVAVPIAAAAQTIGLVAVLVGLVWQAAGEVLAVPAGWLSGGILVVAEWAAAAPRLDPMLLVSPVVIAGAVALGARRRAPRLAASALVAVVVLVAVPRVVPQGPVPLLRVTALDVGQGDAILVEAPGLVGASARILVDGGPDPDAVLALLRGRGVRGLDAVVVSHPHDDHTAGLPAVLRALPVGALVVGPTPLDPARAALSAAETERLARDRGVPVLRVAAGDRFALGAAEVAVLSPPADGSLAHDLNEDSVVLRIDGDHGSVLLTGDAELGAQTQLLARPAAVRATVVKVPHHGGATNALGFLDAVGASDALIGVGADNPYGHPNPRVLDDLAGVRIHRTDTDGTITLVLTPEGVTRRPRRSRRSQPAGASAFPRRTGPGSQGGGSGARGPTVHAETDTPCRSRRALLANPCISATVLWCHASASPSPPGRQPRTARHPLV